MPTNVLPMYSSISKKLTLWVHLLRQAGVSTGSSIWLLAISWELMGSRKCSMVLGSKVMVPRSHPKERGGKTRKPLQRPSPKRPWFPFPYHSFPIFHNRMVQCWNYNSFFAPSSLHLQPHQVSYGTGGAGNTAWQSSEVGWESAEGCQQLQEPRLHYNFIGACGMG